MCWVVMVSVLLATSFFGDLPWNNSFARKTVVCPLPDKKDERNSLGLLPDKKDERNSLGLLPDKKDERNSLASPKLPCFRNVAVHHSIKILPAPQWTERVSCEKVACLCCRLLERARTPSAMSSSPEVPQTAVARTVHIDIEYHLHPEAVLLILRHGKVDLAVNLRNLEASLPPLDQSWDDLMMNLVSQKRWSCIDRLTSHAKYFPPKLLLWLASNDLSDEALDLFQKMLKQSFRFSVLSLKQVVSSATTLGLAPQYKALIYSNDETIRRIIVGRSYEGRFPSSGLVKLVRQTCLYRLFPRDFPQKGSDYDACLSAACEAGLLTMPRQARIPDELGKDPTLMGLALKFNQPDVVRLLFVAGAASDVQLSQLARHPLLLQRSEADGTDEESKLLPPPLGGYPSSCNVAAARDIRDFLARVTTQPRSLKSLCAAQVGRQIGWGQARKVKVQQLEIPDNLKEELTFTGIKSLLKPKTYE